MDEENGEGWSAKRVDRPVVARGERRGEGMLGQRKLVEIGAAEEWRSGQVDALAAELGVERG